jgi:hypothetical protein
MRNPEQSRYEAVRDSAGPKNAKRTEKSEKIAPEHIGDQPFFEDKTDSCVYLGVEVKKGDGGQHVPPKEAFAEYFYTEDDLKLMRDIATSFRLSQPLLVEGGTGIGKTSAVKRMCADLNLNYCLVSFSENTELMDVIGHKDIAVEDGKETVKWYDGKLIEAIRHGGVAFLDEYNFQGGKVGGRINPIIDSILNGDHSVVLPENDNEKIKVHPNFRLVAAQNPPGAEEGEEFTGRDVLSAEKFGRWTFHKLPLKMSPEMELSRALGMIGVVEKPSVPEFEYRFAGEGVPFSEMKDIPGMKHWLEKYVEIKNTVEAKVRDRSMGRQAQKLYFNPRLLNKMMRYVSVFYRGDINAVWDDAFEYFIIKMFKSEEDKNKVCETVKMSYFVQPAGQSKRRGVDSLPADKGPEESMAESAEQSEFDKVAFALRARMGKMKKEVAGGSAEILTARTPEGKEISVDLDSALGDSKSFFLRSGLSEFAKSLPESVDLSETALARCKEALEQGFDRVVFMPDLETINKVGITNLKAKLADTPLPDGTFSDEGDNYKNESYLEDPIAKKHFLTVSAEAKRAKGYLLFYSSESVPEETKNMTFPQAEKYLQEKNLDGFTLPDYYIIQRMEAEKNKNHSFDAISGDSKTSNFTRLVDSRAPGGCVRAGWNPFYRQVNVYWNFAEGQNPDLGARPAIVVPLL